MTIGAARPHVRDVVCSGLPFSTGLVPMPKTKTKSFAQLQREIATLQKEAIKTYQLSASDLGFSARSATKAATPTARGGKKPAAHAKKSKSSRPAKYRDGDGNIWVGRGPRPAWLSAALKSGKKLEDFAV